MFASDILLGYDQEQVFDFQFWHSQRIERSYSISVYLDYAGRIHRVEVVDLSSMSVLHKVKLPLPARLLPHAFARSRVKNMYKISTYW